ncbi:MAG: ThiF family adenylyltransferase [Treponema sp.]|nr:ThiF family adenylyltransferase [Treponema sp.]
MSLTSMKKKNIVLLPEQIMTSGYCGEIHGKYVRSSGIFNVRSTSGDEPGGEPIGVICMDDEADATFARYGNRENFLLGRRVSAESIVFTCNGDGFTVKCYNLFQNIFSRNTGILESDAMMDKCAFILGCGSVGSLVALELARAGVGKFVLIDNDVLEYHNLCRHQCSIEDIGEYKTDAVKRRILNINPAADVLSFVGLVESAPKEIFDTHCKKGQAILVGGADNRQADVYGNSLGVIYGVPFISIGLWERAFAGEIFYWLPDQPMPCYKCALGDGGEFSGRQSTNRHVYTNQEDLSLLNFEPGISVDINFVTTIGVKLIIDILNLGNDRYSQRLLPSVKQYTLVCNTNNPAAAGEMAEIFSYPLQVTTSLKVGFRGPCPPCEFA